LREKKEGVLTKKNFEARPKLSNPIKILPIEKNYLPLFFPCGESPEGERGAGQKRDCGACSVRIPQ
jgi:hypothetical protein